MDMMNRLIAVVEDCEETGDDLYLKIEQLIFTYNLPPEEESEVINELYDRFC